MFLLAAATGWAQDLPDSDAEALYIRDIFSEVLANGSCYEWLAGLTSIGHRLSGSQGYADAVKYTHQIMDTLGFDSIWLQPCTVPRWVRGEPEETVILDAPDQGMRQLSSVALGNSIGTGPDGVTGEVIEVLSIKELKEMPTGNVAGKVVFFNRPLDVTFINTFRSYRGAVDQRHSGPYEAARMGAVAAIVRSMTTQHDDVPHTGSTRYEPDGPNIPAVAISTNDADYLSAIVAKQTVRVHMKTHCQWQDSVQSFSVIGQIDGTTHPDEIILVGGHLDSWDVGQGAHDDGAGCMQSMDALCTLLALGYRPRRTWRCVFFANEENGLAGGNTYARVSNTRSEFHLAAIESDAGGFTPRGFSCSALKEVQPGYIKQLGNFWDLLEVYGLDLETGGSGADINPLRSQGGLLCGYRCDSQRYFDFHHTEEDIFAHVNERELKLGTASIASLIYLLDKYANKVE